MAILLAVGLSACAGLCATLARSGKRTQFARRSACDRFARARSPPDDRPQARKDVRGRHRVAADGSSGNLMMICGVLLVRASAYRPRRVRESSRSASCAFAASGSGPCRRPGVAYWETPRRISTSTITSIACRCPARAGNEGAAGAGEPAREHAARSRAAAVAIPPRRELRRRQRAHRAHPPLLRRRHRARAVLMSMTDAAAERSAGDAVRAGDDARRGDERRRSARAAAAADLRRDEASARKVGATLIEKGAAIWQRSREGRRARRAGRRAHRGDREARADAAGLADALQGQAGRGEARRVGRSVAARRGEGDRRARSARRSTTCCCRASPARCAITSRRRATRPTA